MFSIRYVLVAFLLVAQSVFAGPSEALIRPNRDFSKVDSIVAIMKLHEGAIKFSLNFKQAPMTVANFLDLAEKGFYNGLTFHRVIPGFMIQTGDPKGDGTGGPGYRIPDESNMLKHFIGAVSMANTGQFDTGGSQFFFCQRPAHHLNGKHTVFGQIIEGLDVIYRVEQGDPILSLEIVQFPKNQKSPKH